MAETEKDRPVRRCAATEITWHAPREQDFADYAPVHSAPGERGQHSPVHRWTGHTPHPTHTATQ
jgi:hypothetical protein